MANHSRPTRDDIRNLCFEIPITLPGKIHVISGREHQRIPRDRKGNQRKTLDVPSCGSSQAWRSRPLADIPRAVQSAAHMKVIDLRAKKTSQWKSLLCRRYTPNEKLVAQVSTILSEVRQRGDGALIGFARQFDRVDFTPADLIVSEPEIQAAT